jgi:small multidrug resistance pump
MTDHLRMYRGWFYAAAIYNVVWGAAVVAFPVSLSRLAGLDVSAVIPLVQVIGMMVGVYAIGYYLLAREPLRYAGLIWIALAGKTLGPAGFVYYAIAGVLPWKFGWTCVFNDVIWWPVFWSFALRYGRGPGPESR